MGVSAAIAVAVGTTVTQVEQSRTARKEGKREMGRQAAASRRAEAQQKDKETVMDEQTKQRKARERQRARASQSTGRQSTILGGETDVGNAGNQAQAGAGKTLLGV